MKKDVSYLIGVATSGFPRLGSNNQPNLIMQFVSLKGIGNHLAQVAGKYFFSVLRYIEYPDPMVNPDTCQGICL